MKEKEWETLNIRKYVPMIMEVRGLGLQLFHFFLFLLTEVDQKVKAKHLIRYN